MQYLPLADPPGLTLLSRLYLHGNSIGAMTSATLSRGLSNCSSLQLLWLQRCSIRDCDLSLLSEGLKSLTHLHTLDLSVNLLTDACVPCLASCLPCMRALMSFRCMAAALPLSHLNFSPYLFIFLQSATQRSVSQSAGAPTSRFPLHTDAARTKS